MNLVRIFKENEFKLWHYFVFNFHFWFSCGLNLGPVLSHWTAPPTLSVTFLKWLHQLVCLYNRKSSFSGISVSPECDSWHTLGISARSGVSQSSSHSSMVSWQCPMAAQAKPSWISVQSSNSGWVLLAPSKCCSVLTLSPPVSTGSGLQSILLSMAIQEHMEVPSAVVKVWISAHQVIRLIKWGGEVHRLEMWSIWRTGSGKWTRPGHMTSVSIAYLLYTFVLIQSAMLPHVPPI